MVTDCQDSPKAGNGRSKADTACSTPLEPSGPAAPLSLKLAGVDLNLLVALEALLVCQNVTHAARRIGQTQPAMSRALSRLRDLLDDDLLVRSSSGMKLTARGEYLAQTMPATMAHLRDVMSMRKVESGTRISINANLTPSLLPQILRFTKLDAGSFKVKTHRSAGDGFVQLRTRTVDYTLGAIAESAADIESATILVEDFVTLVAAGGAQAGAASARQAFLDLTHINLVEHGVECHPQVAQTLIGHGIRQSRLLEVPDVTSAALMASEGGLALTVPRSVAAWMTKTLNLTALRPPLAIPDHEVAMAWLAGTADAARRRLVEDFAEAIRAATALDQAPLRLLQPSSPKA